MKYLDLLVTILFFSSAVSSGVTCSVTCTEEFGYLMWTETQSGQCQETEICIPTQQTFVEVPCEAQNDIGKIGIGECVEPPSPPDPIISK